MKFGVVVFPGSNCDRDMLDSLQQDLGKEVVMLWHKDEDLSQFTTDDCIVLPGGFSYGDYLRCGAIPIAHGEGRYFADESLLDELEANNQILFRYCDEDGELSTEGNPNGAVRNIAGIRNKAGNVFGMMPHPERATNKLLGNIDGIEVFNILGLN